MMTKTLCDFPGLVGRLVTSHERRLKARFRRRHWLALIDKGLTVVLRFLVSCALFTVALVAALALLAFAFR